MWQGSACDLSEPCFAHPRSHWPCRQNTPRSTHPIGKARSGRHVREPRDRAQRPASLARTCAFPRRPKRSERPVSGLAKRPRRRHDERLRGLGSSPSHAIRGAVAAAWILGPAGTRTWDFAYRCGGSAGIASPCEATHLLPVYPANLGANDAPGRCRHLRIQAPSFEVLDQEEGLERDYLGKYLAVIWGYGHMRRRRSFRHGGCRRFAWLHLLPLTIP